MKVKIKSKFYKITLVLLIFAALFRIIYINKNYISHTYNNLHYEIITSKLENIQKKEVNNILSSKNDNENLLVFLGSKDCGYCTESISNTNNIIKENKDLQAYYVAIDLNEDFGGLLEEYNLETIPAIIIKKDNQLKILSTEDIEKNLKEDYDD